MPSHLPHPLWPSLSPPSRPGALGHRPGQRHWAELFRLPRVLGLGLQPTCFTPSALSAATRGGAWAGSPGRGRQGRWPSGPASALLLPGEWAHREPLAGARRWDTSSAAVGPGQVTCAGVMGGRGVNGGKSTKTRTACGEPWGLCAEARRDRLAHARRPRRSLWEAVLRCGGCTRRLAETTGDGERRHTDRHTSARRAVVTVCSPHAVPIAPGLSWEKGQESQQRDRLHFPARHTGTPSGSPRPGTSAFQPRGARGHVPTQCHLGLGRVLGQSRDTR